MDLQSRLSLSPFAVLGTIVCICIAACGGTSGSGGAAPVVTSFTPASGPVGTQVTIGGANFDTASGNDVVKFNGVRAMTITASPTQVTATVPAGAATGKISVTTGGGTATSATAFTVTAPAMGNGHPSDLTLGSPYPGSVTGLVYFATLDANSSGASAQTYVRVWQNAASETMSMTYVVTAGSSIVTIEVTDLSTSPSLEYLCAVSGTPPGLPSCASGGVAIDVHAGTLALVNTPIRSVYSLSPTFGKTGPATGSFTFTPVFSGAAPAISGFTPPSGAPGTAVTITGTNFDTAASGNTVKFNGVVAAVTSASATQLVATVPPAATSGAISVSTAGGTASSATAFSVAGTVSTTLAMSTPFQSIPGLIYDPASDASSTASGATYSRSWKNSSGDKMTMTYAVVPSSGTSLQINLSTSGAPNPASLHFLCAISGAAMLSAFPACSSSGVTIDIAAGTLVMAGTPVASSSPNESGTMSGSFTFNPF